MPASRRFLLIDMGKAIDSTASLTNRLNTEVDRLVPAGREVHFLQAITHDQHLYVFLRELDPTTKKAGRE